MEVSAPSHPGKTEGTRHLQARKPKNGTAALYKQCRSTDRHHLPLSAARRVTAAVLHGAEHCQYWRGITINLTMLDAPQQHERTLRTILDHLRHWQERHGCPAYWVWVREHGARLGDHVHIIAAAPVGTGRKLSEDLRRWLRGPSIRGDLARGTLHTRPTSPLGWLAYAVKTITPADAIKLHLETGIRVSLEKPGGPVIGQRVGVARMLAPKARRHNHSADSPTLTPEAG